MSFGLFVYEKRKDRKKSLQAIANQVAVSKPYIYDIEKGNNKPPADYRKLNQWANALSLTPEEREQLFDLAAANRDLIPSDIVNAVSSDINIKKVIRATISGSLPANIWTELISKAGAEDNNEN